MKTLTKAIYLLPCLYCNLFLITSESYAEANLYQRSITTPSSQLKLSDELSELNKQLRVLEQTVGQILKAKDSLNTKLLEERIQDI